VWAEQFRAEVDTAPPAPRAGVPSSPRRCRGLARDGFDIAVSREVAGEAPGFRHAFGIVAAQLMSDDGGGIRRGGRLLAPLHASARVRRHAGSRACASAFDACASRRSSLGPRPLYGSATIATTAIVNCRGQAGALLAGVAGQEPVDVLGVHATCAAARSTLRRLHGRGGDLGHGLWARES
jgi:hypothetical protein